MRMVTKDLPRFVDLDGDGRSEILMVFSGNGVRPGRLLALSAPGGTPD